MHPEPSPTLPAPALLSDFRLGERTVRPRLNLVEGPGGLVQVEPKIMALLAFLAARAGEVVSKEDLVREVWEGRWVSDDVVWRGIGELRRALGDDGRRVIRTVAKRGYRLVAPIEPVEVVEPVEPAPAPYPVAAGEPATPRPRRLAPAPLVLLALALAGAAAVLVANRARPAAPATAAAPARLAVLPFANLTGDPGQDWLAAGLTEEVTARLAALAPGRLAVVGRTSAEAAARRGDGDVRAMARELDVSWVLEGGLRREGDRVRVTTRLVEAAGQTTIWSEGQDLALDGALRLQSRVAERVAAALGPELAIDPAAPTWLERAAAASPEAHRAYLQGLYFLGRGTPADLAQSRDAFAEAIRLDPGSAPAHAGLADALHLLVLFGQVPPREGSPAAEAAARRALALDPTLATARATLGSILFRFHWDFPAAEAEFERAVAGAPGSAMAHHDLAWYLVAMGRSDEGLAAMRRAQEIDPLSLRANADVGWVLYRARRPAAAVDEMTRVLALEPGFRPARECLVRALASLGRFEEARQAAREGLVREGLPAAEVEALAAGEPRAALRRLAERRVRFLEERARNGRPAPYALAAAHAETGNTDAAFAWLERAYEARDPSLASLAVDPELDGLKGDPRFVDLARRIGLPGF